MKVLLLDISAKHIHKSLAPWYLKAYCDRSVPQAEVRIREHTVNDSANSIIDTIYTERPDVLGFSCYIWNIGAVRETAGAVKALLPDCVIVLGGPEVSFEAEPAQSPFADHLIKGPGEKAFAELLLRLAGAAAEDSSPCREPGMGCETPSPFTQSFFDSFAEGRMASIQNQLVYYESSRGCPFSCSYCLSSTFSGVQTLPLERVFHEIDLLAANGARMVKFIDRTFNADKRRAAAILRHILSMQTECAFHFEAAADLFDDELLAVTEKMPAGRMQLEIGVQSLNPRTLRAVNRETDLDAALANLRKLISFGNTRIHLDLIAGLPFETPAGFKDGVDRCLALRPHMLQVGVLKMLKGTKIREESAKYGYLYHQEPPYQVFQNEFMSFDDLLEIRRVGQIVDRFYNKGVFPHSVGYAVNELFGSGYTCFLELGKFFGSGGIRNLSPKNAQDFMLRFLRAHGGGAKAEQAVKADCLIGGKGPGRGGRCGKKSGGSFGGP
ncbi:MAG: B12-binding domain-containing radical SAM protein [Oscillospiraceae bacterium]|nr:B12-binding domain-containing radical SAM protein [Oscillospiraceae bacterium]